MKMQPDIMTDHDINRSLSLQVHIRKKKEGVFVLEPVGSINAMTAWSLQNLLDRICASKPDVIMFNLKRVDFINSKGLRVILKAYRIINAHGGRVVLMNFQPHIKKVFEIIHALPEQRIFASYLEFDHYLAAIQTSYTDGNRLRTSAIETDNCIICAEINADQRHDMNSQQERISKTI